jgi:uncharacterized integral membrane protein
MSQNRPSRLIGACAAVLVLVFVTQNVVMVTLGILRWQPTAQALAGGICRAPAPK